MSDKNSPVGFFDSGIGGISVLKEAFETMPFESFIYFGDNKNAPYGEKTEEEIKDLTLACGEFLYRRGVKAIVMACNTATSAAVLLMREKYNIPVVSMEPAVKPAVAAAGNGTILVLATPATINQQRYKKLLETVGKTEKIISAGCPGLVEIIEKGDFDSPDIDSYLENKLKGFDGMEIDAIVLGCTHYTFIRENIEKHAKAHFKGMRRIFDGNGGTVRQLKRVLEENGILNDLDKEGSIRFYTSSEENIIPLFEELFYQKRTT